MFLIDQSSTKPFSVTMVGCGVCVLALSDELSGEEIEDEDEEEEDDDDDEFPFPPSPFPPF